MKIGIIGLGYVGLPLAVEFGKRREVLGFDIDNSRIEELKNCYDRTEELIQDDFRLAAKLEFTSDPDRLNECMIFIVTVPTPIDKFNAPDLSPLISASKIVGKCLTLACIVIYESTVYPGCTEEVCVPVLEEASGLKFNKDFFVGYSPERINPGDKGRKLPDIKKITSGSTLEVAKIVDDLYASIIKAGTHLAPSIKVAEAAKIVENIQRDTNIALMNELSVIFDRVGIDTSDVLEAAGTKWNFHKYSPGLVGGHCIGVDPYYMIEKSMDLGYYPKLISSARSVNEGVTKFIANKVNADFTHIEKGKILVLGTTFKENCPDTRNSKVYDLASQLESYGHDVSVWDPYAHYSDVTGRGVYDTIILAVPHKQFLNMGVDRIKALGKPGCKFYDLKGVFPKSESDFRL
jgi:UDP-N-acetyl-D-galactosamine dehydrogenase